MVLLEGVAREQVGRGLVDRVAGMAWRRWIGDRGGWRCCGCELAELASLNAEVYQAASRLLKHLWHRLFEHEQPASMVPGGGGGVRLSCPSPIRGGLPLLTQGCNAQIAINTKLCACNGPLVCSITERYAFSQARSVTHRRGHGGSQSHGCHASGSSLHLVLAQGSNWPHAGPGAHGGAGSTGLQAGSTHGGSHCEGDLMHR